MRPRYSNIECTSKSWKVGHDVEKWLKTPGLENEVGFSEMEIE